jgi:hypothetical protein
MNSDLKRKERRQKLTRVLSKPECCEGCIYCIEEGYRYFCTPIKEKHGYIEVNASDKLYENDCCRFRDDYIYKKLNNIWEQVKS